jgi:hypothetical protein
MRQLSRNESLELGYEPMQLVGRETEPEQFDGDKSIVLGIVRAIHRTERSRANLMEYPEGPERVWRRGAGGIRMQWNSSSLEGASS